MQLHSQAFTIVRIVKSRTLRLCEDASAFFEFKPKITGLCCNGVSALQRPNRGDADGRVTEARHCYNCNVDAPDWNKVRNGDVYVRSSLIDAF